MARAGFERRWRTVLNPAVAVNTDWTLRVPGNAWWRITSITARLVTDANAANRIPTLRAGDQTNIWFAQSAPIAIPANTTADLCAHTGSGVTAAGSTTVVLALPAEGLLLPPGHRLQVVTTALQAGDQWSNVFAQIDEIPTDAPYVSNVGTQGLSSMET